MVYGGNRWLTKAEQRVNAEYILQELVAAGWTKQAVCGVLGNMQSESSINPEIWQGLHSYEHDPYTYVKSQGFGLVQWTPFNKYTIWAKDQGYDYKSIDAQLARIKWEVENKTQWLRSHDPFNRSFYEFTQSTASPYELALSFLAAYERPADPNQPHRGTQALEWYNLLTGEVFEPLPPEKGEVLPFPRKKKRTDIIALYLANVLRGWKK